MEFESNKPNKNTSDVLHLWTLMLLDRCERGFGPRSSDKHRVTNTATEINVSEQQQADKADLLKGMLGIAGDHPVYEWMSTAECDQSTTELFQALKTQNVSCPQCKTLLLETGLTHQDIF